MQLIKAKVTAFVSPPSPPSSALTNPSTQSVTSLLLPPPPPPPAYHTLLPWLQRSQSSKNCRQLPIRRWMHTHRYQPIGYSHQLKIFKSLLASYWSTTRFDWPLALKHSCLYYSTHTHNLWYLQHCQYLMCEYMFSSSQSLVWVHDQGTQHLHWLFTYVFVVITQTWHHQRTQHALSTVDTLQSTTVKRCYGYLPMVSLAASCWSSIMACRPALEHIFNDDVIISCLNSER